MDIGKIIREVEIVREEELEPFPFETEPIREPARRREQDEPIPARNSAR
jgi:hypothetical protein